MEEQSKSKVVGMNTEYSQSASQKKPSYEELTGVAVKLSKENTYLKQQLQGATETLRAVNRLDYLFKVVEIMSNPTSSWHFSDDFTAMCIEEIEEAMTPPKELEIAKEK